MEAVAILAITNASFGIARSLVHTIKELYELAEAYETAALGIRTVATQCNSFRIAVERINKWLVQQDEDSRHDLDEDFWQALSGNLDTAQAVIDDLEKRIQGLKKNPAKFWIRTKYLWNGVIIAELQSQIQGLMSAVSLLIQVIDIPTPGAKRARSRAQSKRLNGLTVSNRRRVAESRKRVAAEEKGLLDAEDSHDGRSAKETDPAVFNSEPQPLEDAPPPYDYASNASAKVGATEQKSPPPLSHEASLAPEPATSQDSVTSSFRVLDRSKSNDQADFAAAKKHKSSLWKNFIKRGSKESSRSQSDPIGSVVPETNTTPELSPPLFLEQSNSHQLLHEMPGDSYFQPQEAMSGMDLSQNGENSVEAAANATGEEACLRTALGSSVATPPEQKPSSNRPYRERRSRPDYSSGRADSSDNFHRIRPSQRVKDAHELSGSRSTDVLDQASTSPPPDSLERTSTGASRLGSLRSGSSDDCTQMWQTTAITNRPQKFKVQIERESFTNKISVAAARALGVDDAIVEYLGVSIATITLLYTVSDGLSTGANIVVGDEIEFVLMDEHTSRTPLLVLGAGLAHFAQIAEEGEFIYWNPRAVPDNLRSIDKLRLYRRFELVRW